MVEPRRIWELEGWNVVVKAEAIVDDDMFGYVIYVYRCMQKKNEQRQRYHLCMGWRKNQHQSVS